MELREKIEARILELVQEREMVARKILAQSPDLRAYDAVIGELRNLAVGEPVSEPAPAEGTSPG